jgi:sterol desaturase/sphingolipid hydroxylase (fatty acid hydroxylase superfamily)
MGQLLSHASDVYAYDYFGVLFVLAVLEWVLPRQPVGVAVRTRWIGNVAVAAVDFLVLRLLLPVAGVAWAATCARRGWGVFNHVAVAPAIGVVSSVAILDAIAYGQHVLFHRIPVLWRLHRTHHTDHEVDFTTGFRFHPI